MSEPSGGDRNPSPPKKRAFRWPLMQRHFIENGDDTDKPNFDKGSWVSVLVVLALIVLGVALMVMLAYQS